MPKHYLPGQCLYMPKHLRIICPENFWAYGVSQDPSDSKSRLAVDSCPIYTRSRGQGLRESRAPIG